MAAFRRSIAILVISLLQTSILAQEASESTSADISEDQLIAEAIWSLVDLGSGKTADVHTAFRKAETAFPNSARVAYWRGRFGVYASNRAQVFSQLTETLKTLSNPPLAESEISDPSVRRKLRNMRSCAETIGKRIEQRAKEVSVDDATNAFESSLLKAVSHDPGLIAAWAALLESSDTTIALTAADAWASQEPGNALPLYGKAVILTRDAKPIGTSEIDIGAIEALEHGNARPFCTAPDEPWPTEFSLVFPSSVPADLADFASKPVSPNQFRTIVEEMFFQIDAIGGGATISESSLRDLGTLVLSRSHRLSAEADVRYLRAFAGVGVHLVNSNRFLYGITAGSVDRVLNRLETIAVDQGDFTHAQQIANIRDYVLTTRRKIADDFRATERGEDPSRVDRDATRVMVPNRRSIEIPPIEFDDKSEGPLIISDDGSSPDINMVHIDLFYSSDYRVFARWRGQRLHNERPKSDELKQLGYYPFEEAVEAVRSENRERRLRRGVFFIANDEGLGREIADACFAGGYLGKRDACIVAFLKREQLESFREHFGHVDVRVAQVLGPGDIIDGDDLGTISPKADLVVVPANRLIDSNGQVPLCVRSSKLSFVVARSAVEQRNNLALMKSVRSVVGVLESPLVQIESGASRPNVDEP